MKYYAGIGSRKTPIYMLALMRLIARSLSADGWTLRSGGAQGADTAFQAGAEDVRGAADIYYAAAPTGRTASGPATRHIVAPDPWTYPIAADHHPAWDRLPAYVRALHARNVHQVLGPVAPGHVDYEPSTFVVCWTPDGATSYHETYSGTGGTGQAIRVADAYDVPVRNLAREDHRAAAAAYTNAVTTGGS